MKIEVAAGPVEFSTAGLPDRRRVEAWEGHNEDALLGLRCRTLGADQLEATELNLQLADLHLARVRGSSHVVERDRAMIERRPSESVVMYFNLGGDAFFYSEDGVRTVNPGQLLICDADRAFMRGFSRGLEELVVKIPRQVFRDATGLLDIDTPAVVDFLDRTNVHAAALARHVGRATQKVDPAPADERSILELIAVLTGGRRDDHTTAHRAAARAWIDRHLVDLSLSAKQVADGVGISLRHLSRIFAEDGTTVPKFVLERRLELAHALLRRPAAETSTIADIAHASGFASAAHFSNAFVRRFEERASDVRRSAASERAAARRS